MILDKIKGARNEKIERIWSVGIKCNVCKDPGVMYVKATLEANGAGRVAVKLSDNLKDGHWEEVLFE